MPSSWAVSLGQRPPAESARGFSRFDLFLGRTPCLADLDCHASLLQPGCCPHPPHEHRAEELLIVLDGDAEIVVGDDDGRTVRRLRRGGLAYYPIGFAHTIRNPGERPLHYLMLRWENQALLRERRALHHGVFFADRRPPDQPLGEAGFGAQLVFEGPTRHLGMLHCHVSRAVPGGGYAEHADPYDVALLVLDGRVRTLGRELGPDSVAFFAQGEPHGLRCVGDVEARYLVFEFHAARFQVLSPPLAKKLLARVPQSLKRRVPLRWRRAIKRSCGLPG